MNDLQRIASALESVAASGERLREWFEADRVRRQRAARHGRYFLIFAIIAAAVTYLFFIP